MVLLEVKNLKMYYQVRSGWVKAVDDVSFDIDRGEALGIVGESGCGKTSVALSIIRLFPPNAKILNGQILLDGQNLVDLVDDDIRKVRWKRISFVFQGVMNSLNPVQKVGDQIMEPLRIHERVSSDNAKKRVAELLCLTGMDPSRMNDYPHELSGGMKQRVMIAMSLVCNPNLLIADEPTTALDVVIQDQILQEIKNLQKKLKLAVILITHDISVVAETCDKIIVMYAGKILEFSDCISIFKSPSHPYTIALLHSFPSIRGPLKKLVALSGRPPTLLNPPSGCRFAPRCPISKDVCNLKEPPLIKVANGHYSRCHFAIGSELRKINLEDDFTS